MTTDTAGPTAAILDVNNLVWTLSRPSIGLPHRLAALQPVIAQLRARGIEEVVAVADANIAYLVADVNGNASGDVPEVLRGSIDRFIVVATGEPADRTILDLARELDAWIVSNDHFREWKKRDKWVKRNAWKRRVTVKPESSSVAASAAASDGEPSTTVGPGGSSSDSISLSFPV